MEVEDTPLQETVTVELSAERFLKDCEARQLSEATLGKYGLLFKELQGKRRSHQRRSEGTRSRCPPRRTTSRFEARPTRP